ncbi:inositol monophosphatase [Candidatus Pelagibacter sp.]|nr:inositol monophosphatase [Candidatus Pelagibacter sp.]
MTQEQWSTLKKYKMNSISPNLNLMIKACEKASKVIIRDFGELENLQVSKKGPKDFVTKTDKRVEKILIEELTKSKKNYSFITEETGKIMNNDENTFWIIDPIDGTTNFLHGVPHFAISVALQKEDEIIIGLIFDPIKNEIFYAEKNSGSFLNNNRSRVSNKTNLDECLFASNNEGIKSIYPKLNIRNTGCAALDLAYVGCGRLDGYFHNKINLWDIAAGKIIIEEAGGKVNNIYDYKINKIDIRAGNPNIYEKMLKKLENF